MTQGDRRRFTRVSDWHEFLGEIRKQTDPSVNLYTLRQLCYKDIEELRERPLLVYAAQFPTSAPPPPHPQPPTAIDLGDVDGFTDLASSVSEADSIDVLIHSPGGSPEATERIVALLRSNFEKITFLVPHSAYSAATMLALSGNNIIIHPSASLGPIDPQINGTPARAIKRGFNKAREALKKEGPEALPAYVPLIEKYSLQLLEICEDYEKLSKELVSEWLQQYMFEGDDTKAPDIQKAVEFFSGYDNHKTHNRALTFDKLDGLGLKISQAEGELAEFMREAHILLSGFFSVSSFVKLYENSDGLSWGHQFEVMTVQKQGRKQK